MKRLFVILISVLTVIGLTACVNTSYSGTGDTDTTEEVVTETSQEPELTAGQENAYKAAKNYLSIFPFSRQGLITQLSSDYGDGYAIEDAEFAVNYLVLQILII